MDHSEVLFNDVGNLFIYLFIYLVSGAIKVMTKEEKTGDEKEQTIQALDPQNKKNDSEIEQKTAISQPSALVSNEGSAITDQQVKLIVRIVAFSGYVPCTRN